MMLTKAVWISSSVRGGGLSSPACEILGDNPSPSLCTHLPQSWTMSLTYASACFTVRKNFCFAAERSFSRRRPFCRRARFGSACCNECDDTLRSHPLSLLIVHRSGNVALLTCPVCVVFALSACAFSAFWMFVLVVLWR